MKEKIKTDNMNDKKKCKICLWGNNTTNNYCEQCGYRFVNILKVLFLSKNKCRHDNQKFRYCSKCGCKLNYSYKTDSTDSWTPTPYTDRNIEKIRKKWYQFWR